MASFYEQLFGSGPQVKSLETYNPQQKAFQGQSLQNAAGLLGNLSKPSDISGITNSIRRNFETQTIPSLAERFTSLGGSGQRSSAFANALGRAGSDLESNIGVLETQNQQQDLSRLQNLFSLLSSLGNMPQQQHYQEQGKPGFFGNYDTPVFNQLFGGTQETGSGVFGGGLQNIGLLLKLLGGI